jgi:5-methyltetrahydrofolate--homocysteine methyltransferase
MRATRVGRRIASFTAGGVGVLIDVFAMRKAMDGIDPAEVERLVTAYLLDGIPAPAILNDGFIAAMDIVGKEFRAREIFVPEVLLAARNMHKGISLLKPHLATGGEGHVATVVLGTVKGDIHDIGKNIVSIMLTGASFRVVDLGTNVPVEKFVAAVRDENADLVGLSALLTTTMMGMKHIVATLRETFGASGPKVMVGGAPVTQEYAQEIGADGYAGDAVSAVELTRQLVAARKGA